MRIRKPHAFPSRLAKARARAGRLEWLTLAGMGSVCVVMYLVLGNSQAMRTAWVEDLLSLVPPIAVLIALRIEQRPPNKRFPFGFYRTISIAFLCAALTLTVFGALLLFEAIKTLVTRDHPTIGTMQIFGMTIWQGWLMILALVYSVIPPIILGRMKEPVALELHNKALHADARMNRADWMTGGAAMLGVIGIGFGLWWADAAAAAVISLDVLRDGLRNLATAVNDLVDKAPRRVDQHSLDPLHEEMRQLLSQKPWVDKAAVMLREEGHLLTGQVYIVPRTAENLVERIDDAVKELTALDWRLYDLAVMPVKRLE